MSSNFQWQVGGCGCGCECQYGGKGIFVKPENIIILNGTYDPQTRILSSGGEVGVQTSESEYLISPWINCRDYAQTPCDEMVGFHGLTYLFDSKPIKRRGSTFSDCYELYHGDTFLGGWNNASCENESFLYPRIYKCDSGYYDGGISIDEDGFLWIWNDNIKTDLSLSENAPSLRNDTGNDFVLDGLVIYPKIDKMEYFNTPWSHNDSFGVTMDQSYGKYLPSTCYQKWRDPKTEWEKFKHVQNVQVELSGFPNFLSGFNRTFSLHTDRFDRYGMDFPHVSSICNYSFSESISETVTFQIYSGGEDEYGIRPVYFPEEFGSGCSLTDLDLQCALSINLNTSDKSVRVNVSFSQVVVRTQTLPTPIWYPRTPIELCPAQGVSYAKMARTRYNPELFATTYGFGGDSSYNSVYDINVNETVSLSNYPESHGLQGFNLRFGGGIVPGASNAMSEYIPTSGYTGPLGYNDETHSKQYTQSYYCNGQSLVFNDTEIPPETLVTRPSLNNFSLFAKVIGVE